MTDTTTNASDSKKFWESKTFWANLIGIGAMVAQSVNGSFVMPPEWQAAILAVINIVLRLVTKQEIVW
jgi:hypothetical protein